MSSSDTLDNEGFEIRISSSELFKSLNTFRQTGLFCDIIVKSGHTHFQAHKVVLAAFSPVFQAMFSGGFAEANQSTAVFETVEADVMEIILDYAYSNLIHIANSNVQAVLHAANFFQAETLFKACCDYIEKHISAENCFCIWALTSVYSWQYPSLMEKAKNFAIVNFTAACWSQDFLELGSDDLIDLIKNDSLNVDREDIVLEAVVRWLCHKSERLPVGEKVLSHVRLALVDPAVLYDWVETLDLHNLPSCMKLVEEARKYHLLPSRRAEVSYSLMKHRLSSLMCEVLLIHEEFCDESSLTCLNSNGECLKTLKYPPGECRNIEVSNYDQMMLACCWDEILRYNFETDDWTKIAANLKPRFFFGLCELDGFWYSIGGKNIGSHSSDTIEKYDPATNVWKQLKSMPVPVCHKGKIFVLGGELKNNRDCDQVQRYDPRSNKWTLLTNMPVPFKYPAACVLEGTIYLFGLCRDSQDEGRQLHVYNVSTNQWQLRNEVPHQFFAGPVIMDGSIFVLTKTTLNHALIMRYKPSSDSWVQFGSFTDFKPKVLCGPLTIKNPHS